jgi:hypothetical protein
MLCYQYDCIVTNPFYIPGFDIIQSRDLLTSYIRALFLMQTELS